jgi:ankyrin repeat protein
MASNGFLVKKEKNDPVIFEKKDFDFDQIKEYYIEREIKKFRRNIQIDQNWKEENHVLNELEHGNLVVISGEPGMGKSTLLKYLSNELIAQNKLVKLVLLKDKTEWLDSIKTGKKEEINQEDFLRFLNIKDTMEQSIFGHPLEKNKVFILLDGLDEVKYYKEQVYQIIDYCLQNKAKVVVSSRKELNDELEDKYSILCYKMRPFQDSDCQRFLNLYLKWLKKDGDETEINNLANVLLEKFRVLESGRMQKQESTTKFSTTGRFQSLKNFIEIPLQLKMIADISIDSLDNGNTKFLDRIVDIKTLYDLFFEKKFERKYQRENMNSHQNPTRVKNEKEMFLRMHCDSARNYLLAERNQIDIKEIIKYGIITRFKNGKPVFVHQTFAEYFLARYYYEQIKNNRKSAFKKLVRNKIVRRFLIDETDEYGTTALHLASLNGHKNIVELLTKSKSMINKKNSFTETPLYLACLKGNKDVVQLLIEKGAQIQEKNIFDETALHLACEKGHFKIVELLIKQGANVDEKYFVGRTSLHLASENGHKVVVQFLIEEDANVNEKDKDGQTALHLASENGHKVVVQLLIKKGAKVNEKDKDGQTALHLACENGHLEIVKLLLENKGKVNQYKKNGHTALHLASSNGHKDLVKLLVKKKAYVNKKDINGGTALHLAYENGHLEVVDFLNKKVANTKRLTFKRSVISVY